MTNLSVNLNKVALLRNQRTMTYPSVVDMAKIVLGAGAQGITVHPRPDARHIRAADVRDIAALLRSHYGPEIEFNVEGNPTDEFLESSDRTVEFQHARRAQLLAVTAFSAGRDVIIRDG